MNNESMNNEQTGRAMKGRQKFDIQESDELVRILYTIVENARQSSRSKTGR